MMQTVKRRHIAVSPVLSHPDYDRRLRNYTESADPETGYSGARGLQALPVTAGGEFHPALRTGIHETEFICAGNLCRRFIKIKRRCRQNIPDKAAHKYMKSMIEAQNPLTHKDGSAAVFLHIFSLQNNFFQKFPYI